MKTAYLIYDSSESNPDLFYATRFFAPDRFLYMKLNGKSYIFVSDLEYDRAKKQAKVNYVVPISGFGRKIPENPELKWYASRLMDFVLKKKKIKKAVLPADTPVLIADELRMLGYKVEVKQLPFFEERVIKRADELSAIRKVAVVAQSCMKEAIRVISSSKIKGKFLYHNGKKLTSEKIKAVVSYVAASYNCSAEHTIISCGRDSAMPHMEGAGLLYANQSIIMDIFPRSLDSGFYADISRTVVRGKASPKLKSMYETVRKAQKKAIKEVKAGIDAKNIHTGVCRYFESKGFRTKVKSAVSEGFFHSLGHGVGVEIHEEVRLSVSSYILKKGMVVTVEPGLYYPDTGGIRIEDMVVVTEKGCRLLTHPPDDFEI